MTWEVSNHLNNRFIKISPDMFYSLDSILFPIETSMAPGAVAVALRVPVNCSFSSSMFRHSDTREYFL